MRALLTKRAIDDTTPISPPIASSHAFAVMTLGRKQVRHNPPPEGWLAVFRKVNVAVAEWTSDPLVPLIVSVWLPASVVLHEIVAETDPTVPRPNGFPGLIEPHASPDGTLSVRETAPVKPYNEPTVIVEAADWPVLTVLGEDAAIVKSAAGGPTGVKARRHPHPMGLLLHCNEPNVPAPGVLVQLPAVHQTQFILWGELPS